MPDTTPDAGITLTRDGISATVRVGDVLPMTDGTTQLIAIIDARPRGSFQSFPVYLKHTGWYDYAGRTIDTGIVRYPDIDLAALARPGVVEHQIGLLADALGKVLIHVGMLAPDLGGRGGITGPELLCAADTFLQSPTGVVVSAEQVREIMEAVAPFNDVLDNYAAEESGAFEVWKGWNVLGRRITVGDHRRLRAALAAAFPETEAPK